METDRIEREKCFLLVTHLLQSHHPPISVFLSFWLHDHPQFESFHHWELCLQLCGSHSGIPSLNVLLKYIYGMWAWLVLPAFTAHP